MEEFDITGAFTTVDNVTNDTELMTPAPAPVQTIPTPTYKVVVLGGGKSASTVEDRVRSAFMHSNSRNTYNTNKYSRSRKSCSQVLWRGGSANRFGDYFNSKDSYLEE